MYEYTNILPEWVCLLADRQASSFLRNPPHPAFGHLLLGKEKGILSYFVPSPY
jgi:hypothetical protein